jgi:hypothetical protein
MPVTGLHPAEQLLQMLLTACQAEMMMMTL